MRILNGESYIPYKATRLPGIYLCSLLVLLSGFCGEAAAQHVSGHSEAAGDAQTMLTLTGSGLNNLQSIMVGNQTGAITKKSDTSATVEVFSPSFEVPGPPPGTTVPIIVKFSNGHTQVLGNEFSWPIGTASVTGPTAPITDCPSYPTQTFTVTGLQQPLKYTCVPHGLVPFVNPSLTYQMPAILVSNDSPSFHFGVGPGGVYTLTAWMCVVKSGKSPPPFVPTGNPDVMSPCTNWDGYKGTWQPIAGARVQKNVTDSAGNNGDDLSIVANKIFDDQHFVRTLLFELDAVPWKAGPQTALPGLEAWSYQTANVVRAPLAQVQMNTLPYALIYEPPGDQSTASISFSTLYNTNFTLTNGSGTTNKGSTETSGQIQFGLSLAAGTSSTNALKAQGSTTSSWDNTTMSSFGTTSMGAKSDQASTSFTISNTAGPIATLVPGSGATCPSETSCVPLITNPDAYTNEPFWNDQFLLMIHPQFAIYENLAGKTVTVMTGAVPVIGGMTVLDLTACATGNGSIPGIPPCDVDLSAYQIEPSSGTSINYDTSKLKVTLTKREAANLLKLDPFYGVGQNVKSLGARATTPMESPSYGARAGDHTTSSMLNLTNIQQTQQTNTGMTQYASSITSVLGNSSSFGLSLTVPVIGESLTIGSSDKVTGETDTQVSYQDSTAVSTQKTTTAAVTLADSDTLNGNFPKGHGPLPQKPSTLIFLDRTFGGFMFVDPYAPGPPSTKFNLQPIAVRAALRKEGKKTRYPDVPLSNPDHDAIGLASRAGWIGASTGDKFAPSDPISRADLAILLSKAKGLPPDSGKTSFKDVPATLPSARYITGIVSGGYMLPTSATSFAPDATVTLQDLTLALSKAFNQKAPAVPVGPQVRTAVSREQAAAAVVAAMDSPGNPTKDIPLTLGAMSEH
jgi:hypothetical protein